MKLDELKYLYPSTSKDVFKSCQEPPRQENKFSKSSYNRCLILVPEIKGNGKEKNELEIKEEKDVPSPIGKQLEISATDGNEREKSILEDMDTDDINLPKPVDSDEIIKELFPYLDSQLY